ncbi:PP2C family protein-serine/threonine phosphatase [Isoptericola croceus]|uniref:PP2C family protein-serine/threonine phosphatase n=1 Tax=Isoptericola croceus TaxID=3031406 RepID=UPI0023F8FE71|nr:protein phosphatase 2C domain-containing protein [Isoptericola croceus]
MTDRYEISLLWGAATHRGARRRLNEDAYVAGGPAFFVADGMGGHDAGDVASAVAVTVLEPLTEVETVAIDALRTGVDAAHEVIRGIQAPPDRHAGTTLTGVTLTSQEGAPYWLVVNLGDSRTYRLADGALEQVSVDHSEVQELVDAGEISAADALTHPRRHVVTRVLGSPEDPVADYWFLPVHVGQRWLLCSDGLTSEVGDGRLAELLGEQQDPQRAADRLVDEALAAGGRDNITVVVVDVTDAQEPVESTIPRAQRVGSARSTQRDLARQEVKAG